MSSTFRKQVKPGSPLTGDLDFAERALGAISKIAWRAILNPILINGKFIHRDGDSFSYFTKSIDNPRTLWAEKDKIYERHLEALWSARRDLEDAGRAIDLHSAASDQRHLSLTKFALSSFQSGKINVCGNCKEKAIGILEKNIVDGLRTETLLHADFHPGNVIRSGDLYKVIDLDNISAGPKFGDVLYCSIWGFYIQSRYFEALGEFESAIGRRFDESDIAWAVSVMTRQAIGNTENTRKRIELGIHWLLHELVEK